MDQTQVVVPPAGGPGFVERTREFLVSVRAELGKVTWPTRDELTKATRMVVIFAVVLGLAIGLLDWLLNLILVKGVAQLAQ